ncbi:MAG TPA: tetratricopeptide repeat protein [Opitutaceae bacterium]|nr:tetratricopeptide repeat protein [Opitutaceae bacterium]
MNASQGERVGPGRDTSKDTGYAALVLCATVLAYLPALAGGFIWNDSDYVTAPALRSPAGLARIWTEVGATQQYYPLLHSFFWVQHALFGDHPLGYHIVTLLLHAGSAVLFALVLRRLLAGTLAGAEWLAALLVALHPAHVESVAWITEQKNTASLAFYLAAALLYLRFDETRRPGAYAGALALFACSLACKTVTASLPAALLVAFWWRRGRLDWRRDVAPLVPWLALGAAAGLFSGWVERHYVGAQGTEFDIPAASRALVAGRAVWFYLGTLAWPSGLNFVYPRWDVDPAVAWQWLFPIGVLALGAALWALRRRSRGPLAAFLFFTGSLFPALGFVNLYGARYSWVWDHWQYLPDLGPIALAAAALVGGWRRMAPGSPGLGAGLAAALAALLGALTWSHCGMFHDDERLYRETIRRNPDTWLAHNNLGLLLSTMPGRANDAVEQYEEALRLRPDYAMTHYNLGVSLSAMPGRRDDAVAQYREAIRLKPDYAEAHNNLANAWSAMPGRLDDAIAEYGEALRLAPGNAEAHYNLGLALSRTPGRLEDAAAQYKEAIRLRPGYVEAHDDLGATLSAMPGRMDEAIAQYREALRLDPAFAPGWRNLGAAWFNLGNIPAATDAFREVLRLRPDSADAHFVLGLALSRTPGGLEEAIAQYREALRLAPGYPAAQKALDAAVEQAGSR